MSLPPVSWDWAAAEALACRCEHYALLLETGGTDQQRICRDWPRHWHGRAHRAAERAAARLLRERHLLAADYRYLAQQLRAASARARTEQLRRDALQSAASQQEQRR